MIYIKHCIPVHGLSFGGRRNEKKKKKNFPFSVTFVA